jgi:DNA-binding NarL/FixJ family response regulator
VYTVAVVDDSPVARAGMARMLSDDMAVTVVAAVAPVYELDEQDLACDVVVLGMPAGETDDVLATVARLARRSRVVVISSWSRSPTVLTVVRAGAKGCLTHHSQPPAVREAVRTVARGGLYVCPQLGGQFQAELTKPAAPGAGRLAPREVETLRGIALGFTHRQIAVKMGLSRATVETYAKRLRSKLHVNNKADLTRMAIKMGHVSAQPGSRRAP